MEWVVRGWLCSAALWPLNSVYWSPLIQYITQQKQHRCSWFSSCCYARSPPEDWTQRFLETWRRGSIFINTPWALRQSYLFLSSLTRASVMAILMFVLNLRLPKHALHMAPNFLFCWAGLRPEYTQASFIAIVIFVPNLLQPKHLSLLSVYLFPR